MSCNHTSRSFASLWRLCFVSFVVAVLLLSSSVAAQGPSEPGRRIMDTIDLIRETVSREKATLGEAALDEKLEGIIEPVFDFDEMSRRCLGPHWNTANDSQKKRFVELFSSLLSRTYLKKIKDGIETSEIRLSEEREIEEGKAVKVKTSVLHNGQEVKIEYRMFLQGDSWRVYDVLIENLGLVKNYRGEFAGIIRHDGMDGLIEKLAQKVERPAEEASKS